MPVLDSLYEERQVVANQEPTMNRQYAPQVTLTGARNSLNGQSSLYFARLMTPTEVAGATSRQPLQVRQKTEGHWVLCGDVSAPMFDLLKDVSSPHLPTRLTGFNSSGGFGYCVMTHQVLRHQNRFVLSLYDPAVRMLLEAITKSAKLSFMLGNDDGDNALLLECPLKPIEFMPLLAMSSEATLKEQRAALHELPILMATMCNPLQVPSLFSGVPVQHVSVSMLLPCILDEGFRAVLSKAASE